MAYNGCTGHPSFAEYSNPGEPCYIDAIELGFRNAIAAERMIASLLSVLGCASIISLVLTKGQLCNSKVQPIFVLALADLVLALMWVSGAVVWFRLESPNREWCLAIFLITVILGPVTSNLNLVYALMVLSAYSNGESSKVEKWSAQKTVVAYVVAWLEPTVVFMTTFGIIGGVTGFVDVANDCSCWCLPYYVSVLPLAPEPYGNATASIEMYTSSVKSLVVSTAVISAAHYLVVFILLIIIYMKFFRLHRRQRGALLGEGYNPQVSKKAAFYFLAVFAINGGTNLVISLSYLHVFNDGNDLTDIDWHVMVILTVQSLVGPLQGFFNAIVYGWAQDDFISEVVVGRANAESEMSRRPVAEKKDIIEPECDTDIDPL